jgi:hypothetical protein
VTAETGHLEADIDGGTPSFAFLDSVPSYVDGGILTLNPTAAGTTVVSLGVAGDTYAVNLRTSDPGDSATPIVALLVGDSLTADGRYPEQVQVRTAGVVTLVGLEGNQDAGPHEGHGGWSAANFYNQSQSPFTVGADLDLPAYIASLDAPPDVVVWLLGTNRVFHAADAAAATVVINDEVNLLRHLVLGWPGDVAHGVALTLPGNSSHAAFSSPSRNDWRRRNDEYKRALAAALGGREAEKIYILPTNTSVNPATAYADNLHPTNDYESLGDTVANFLIWYAQSL